MPPIDYRDAKGSLLQKGFREENRDHHYFFFYYEGKKTSAYTYFSHNSKEVDDSLFRRMKKELQLDSGKQVRDLFLCPLNAEQYIKLLKKKTVVP